MSTALAAALRAVRDRLAKLPRSQRWIAGGVVGAIVVAAAVATAALSSPAPAASAASPAAVRMDPRANRGEVRATPSSTPSATPSAAPTTPAAPKPPATTALKPSPTRTRATTSEPVPTSCTRYTGVQRTACSLLPTFGFSTGEMAALVPMWERESGWNYRAYNPSGAYGIPQALPGSKMAVYGSDWQTNPATQIKWGLSYIKSRYGTPSAAWAFWQGHGWY